jgi:hypothetical protein
MTIISGTVAYSALTHRLRYRATDRGLFGIILDDCVCLATQPPRLWDRHNKVMPLVDIPPGSRVNIAMIEDWMSDVQVIELAVPVSPFAATG